MKVEEHIVCCANYYFVRKTQAILLSCNILCEFVRIFKWKMLVLRILINKICLKNLRSILGFSISYVAIKLASNKGLVRHHLCQKFQK